MQHIIVWYVINVLNVIIGNIVLYYIRTKSPHIRESNLFNYREELNAKKLWENKVLKTDFLSNLLYYKEGRERKTYMENRVLQTYFLRNLVLLQH